MPLPRESASQNGRGTGQIWVTSSRPISKGGASRPLPEARPIWAAWEGISLAMAPNSGATGAALGRGGGDHVQRPPPAQELFDVEPPRPRQHRGGQDRAG